MPSSTTRSTRLRRRTRWRRAIGRAATVASRWTANRCGSSGQGLALRGGQGGEQALDLVVGRVRRVGDAGRARPRDRAASVPRRRRAGRPSRGSSDRRWRGSCPPRPPPPRRSPASARAARGARMAMASSRTSAETGAARTRSAARSGRGVVWSVPGLSAARNRRRARQWTRHAARDWQRGRMAARRNRCDGETERHRTGEAGRRFPIAGSPLRGRAPASASCPLTDVACTDALRRRQNFLVA